MKRMKNNSASNAGSFAGTTSQEESIWQINKARYNKHFSAERELMRMERDSYCGEKYGLIIAHLRSLGVNALSIYTLLNIDPYSVVVKAICAKYELDYFEVRATLVRI